MTHSPIAKTTGPSMEILHASSPPQLQEERNHRHVDCPSLPFSVGIRLAWQMVEVMAGAASTTAVGGTMQCPLSAVTHQEGPILPHLLPPSKSLLHT